MPTFAELAAWRDHNLDECERWYRGVQACYGGIGYPEVQAAVDQSPQLLLSRSVTVAVLFALGYDAGHASARRSVIAKMVEQRLDS